MSVSDLDLNMGHQAICVSKSQVSIASSTE